MFTAFVAVSCTQHTLELCLGCPLRTDVYCSLLLIHPVHLISLVCFFCFQQESSSRFTWPSVVLRCLYLFYYFMLWCHSFCNSCTGNVLKSEDSTALQRASISSTYSFSSYSLSTISQDYILYHSFFHNCMVDPFLYFVLFLYSTIYHSFS